ncbi:DUF819 domain containing protein [Nitzschia inconspicua]|uniref:DUF819 domain containing protein n=1 Tax=Nitzschia inconspicua TaxID=303405 RepID=A0A9K3PIE9_9STRA|nr:DUF819 domain containing protein [Nitzschia inconspicua]
MKPYKSIDSHLSYLLVQEEYESLAPVAYPTGASMALAGSSLIGMQLSKWMPSSGILGTLVSGAVAGNMLSQWVPSSHVLYDLCFTLFLPGSLTLLLLAYQPPSLAGKDELGTSSSGSNVDGPKAENSIRACILRVAAPFVIASLASLLGCWLSYRCAGLYQWFGGDLERSRTAAACLSASYVGGSVNCMATARLVGIQSDLLGSLVTADLFTMAIYFSFLSSSLDWSWLRSFFRPSAVGLDGLKDRDSTVVGSAEIETPDNQSHDSLRSKLLCSIPLLFATFGIVQLANRMEDLMGKVVPGTACAVISVVAPLINTRVNQKQWWIPFSAVSTVWSDFFFLSFFASIGVAANLSSALSMGPSCVLFSALALTIHVLGTTFGCLFWKRFLRPNSTMELEDVWIASNAAIGGPATAAAFCNRMKRDPGKLKGRTISATVWGVVGYAIGTTLGVGMYRLVGGGGV